MSDPNIQANIKNPAELAEQTARIQQAIQAQNTGEEKVGAAATEYAADSTYRQSDEYKAKKKLGRALEKGALIAGDAHVVSNEQAFDNWTQDARDQYINEFRETAKNVLRYELGQDYDQKYTEEQLFQQGYVTYDINFSQAELDNLQTWLNSPNPAMDPNLGNLLADLNQTRNCNFSLDNMATARVQVQRVLLDKKITRQQSLSSEALSAAQTLATDRTKLSSFEKSTIVDTLRTSRIHELAKKDAALEQFIKDHPNATAVDWQEAVSYSEKFLRDHGGVVGGAQDVFSQDTVNELKNTFGTFGDVTESTGVLTKNSWSQVGNFFLGDMSIAAGTLRTGYGVSKKVVDMSYDAWLKKSKNSATQGYRDEMAKQRQSLRSGNARERYDAKNSIRDLRANKRYERAQTKRFGSDRNKWEPKATPRHRKFEETLKGKILNKLNNNPITKKIGEFLGAKQKFKRTVIKKVVSAVSKLSSLLWKGLLALIGYAFPILGPVLAVHLVLVLIVVLAGALFGELKPDYAQNCINNLNQLDSHYELALKNGAYQQLSIKDEKGRDTRISKYSSPIYDANIALNTERIGHYVDEYGNVIQSGNNVLPIYLAFKHRTGCVIDDKTYVAFSAYAKVLYWRTHLVQEYLSNEREPQKDFSQCAELSSCSHPYTHPEGAYGCVPSCEKGSETYWCDNYHVEIEKKPTKCGKKEHTHGSGCYEMTCDGHHTESCWSKTCSSNQHIHTIDCLKITRSKSGAITKVEVICSKTTNDHVCNSECYQLSCSGHSHSADCYELKCDKEEHTHSKELTYHQYGRYYSTPCYDVTVICDKHCPGHLDAQYTVECVMDVENIVKHDDLVFTPDALSYGDDVFQMAGTVESKMEAWWRRVTGKNDEFTLNDFYEQFIVDLNYGFGDNEPVLSVAYDDDSTPGIFYKNKTLYAPLTQDGRFDYVTRYDGNERALSQMVDLEKNFVTTIDDNSPAATRLYNLRHSTKLTSKVKSKLKDLYKIRDTSQSEDYNSLDYLSPFLYDNACLNGDTNTPIMKNGWGFWTVKSGGYASGVTYLPDKWIWCTDPVFLVESTGTYQDGYKDAIEAFEEESGLYFANAALGSKPIETNDDTLKVNEALSLLKDLTTNEETNPKFFWAQVPTEKELTDVELSKYSVAAFNCLLGIAEELNSGKTKDQITSAGNLSYYQSLSTYSSPDEYYTPAKSIGNVQKHENETEAGKMRMLSRRYLIKSEHQNLMNTWSEAQYGYSYLMILLHLEADGEKQIGNYMAGEKYYRCLVYEPHSEEIFREVIMSETSLELYHRQLDISLN